MTTDCPFDITPYDQSGRIKTPHMVNIDYTCQDFWSLKSRLRDYIKEQFADNFNDFVESSLAIMLIENWAFIADLLSFKIDQIANEVFIDTVAEIDNAFRLARLVGFHPQPPIAASSLWSATLNNILDTDLIIDTPVIIDINTESGPTSIELFAADVNNNPIFSEPIIISSGNFLNNTVIGLEGRTRTQTNLGDGTVNQFYRLAFSPVIWDSVRVSVNGQQWTQVEYFTDSQPRQEFRVEYDATYNGYVMFGNNRAGMIPSDGSTISISYRTGGGVAGNIVTGSINIQRNYAVPGFNFRVPVTFQNYTRGQFGYDGDTIDDIKQKLPAYLRSQHRAVTSDDYDTLVNQFVTPYNGQIGKSTSVIRNYGCAANVIDIYVLAKDGLQGLVEASNDLKVALQDYLETVKMMTDHVCIKDGYVIEVDVQIDVTSDKYYKKFEDEHKAEVTSQVNAFFSLNNWNYGQDLKNIDLIKQIAGIQEIKTVTVNFITDDSNNSGDIVTSKFYQIIRPQSVEINFVYE